MADGATTKRREPRPTKARPAIAELEPLLIDAETFAAMLQVGHSSFARMRDSGKMGPAPVQLEGAGVRWSLLEVKAWAAAGFPPAREWERRREVAR